MILHLRNESFGNGYSFTKLKENAASINVFVPMYIDFDEYLPYSGTIFF